MDEEPGAKLARRLAASPAGLSREPIVDLARGVAAGKKKSRYLIVPHHTSVKKQEKFLETLSQKARSAETFLTGRKLDFAGSSRDGIVKFDTSSGVLRLNGLHPFVATFDKEFTNKKLGHPLELFAMAEVLAEAHLHYIGVDPEHIDTFLLMRDRLLRDLANESGRQSALTVANELSDARNDSDRLEECVCNAFDMLGFDVKKLGNQGRPNRMATAILPPDDDGKPRRYSVSLEAKNKVNLKGKVDARSVDIDAVISHRDKYDCDHAVVVGPRFTTSRGKASALGVAIENDKQKTADANKPKTVTLIEINDLAKLVRLQQTKLLRLQEIRKLFRCSLPNESKEWVASIRNISRDKPHYREIIETIEALQNEFGHMSVKFPALLAELRHLKPPIIYKTDGEVKEICRAMSHMAPDFIRIADDRVELEQSAQNVIAEIRSAIQEYL